MKREDVEKAARMYAERFKHEKYTPEFADFAVQQIDAALEEAAKICG